MSIHAPKGYSKTKILEEGREEAERVKRTGKSLDQRIIDEVKDYNKRYGIASPADVSTEINSRGKDLQFQGELYAYAYKDLDKIKSRMNKLVREGKLKKVSVPGAKSGYVVTNVRLKTNTRVRWRTNTRTRRRYASIVDSGPSDYF